MARKVARKAAGAMTLRMSDPLRTRMTADEFIAWAMQQDDGRHYELVSGDVIAMAPERAAHARLKFRLARRLIEAVEAESLPCEVFTDGMAVQVDADTVYEPDAILRCGTPVSDDTTRITDPLIVAEVPSPSTRARDTGAKLADYFRIASLHHYLIIITPRPTIIHHARDTTGAIHTRIIQDGLLHLDPPGIHLSGLFG